MGFEPTGRPAILGSFSIGLEAAAHEPDRPGYKAHKEKCRRNNDDASQQ